MERPRTNEASRGPDAARRARRRAVWLLSLAAVTLTPPAAAQKATVTVSGARSGVAGETGPSRASVVARDAGVRAAEPALETAATPGAATTPRDLVPPRAVGWDELVREWFDPAWILPEALPLARGDAPGPAVDLVREARRWLELSGDASADGPASFADVVLAVHRAGGDAAARERVLGVLRARQPALAHELEPVLRELLADEALRSEAWDPGRDDARDGLFFARPLTLDGVRDAPWSRIEGSRLVHQACAFIHADPRTIKQAENDYRAYPRRPGATYEAIHPVEDSHVRGLDPRGAPFAALRLHFRCDLPFPFSDYRCDLAILNRTARDGTLLCDIYSTSRDFLWMVGRDAYFPVRASDGTWVGTLVVRWFGFDLRGVPDGDDARRAGLRSSLGSLKREAEGLFRALGAGAGASFDGVPEFDVRGGR